MPPKISSADAANIVELYKTNLTTRDIAKRYNIAVSYVFKILKNNNYSPKSQHIIHNKKYSINREFFENETWQLAYAMGFGLADGHVVENKHSSILSFYVHTEDKIILEKIKEFSGATHPIFISDKKPNLSQISISDACLKGNLEKWGIVPNKTYEPIIPNVPTELLKPFLIGFIDGDGSINYKDGKQFNIVGHRILMDFFVSSMEKLGFCPDWKFEDKKDKVWKRVILYKKNLILDLVKILEPEKYFFLERKWSNALIALNKNE